VALPSRAALAVVGLSCCLLPSAARLQTGVIIFGSSEAASAGVAPWHFAGKFGYSIGSGSYDIRVRLTEPADMPSSLDLEVFLDEDWDRVGAISVCRRAMLARRTHILRLSTEWSPWAGGLLEQNVRPHIWYFALSKCNGLGDSLVKPFNGTNMPLAVEYELRLQQADRSELSIEVRHMPAAVAIAVVCLSGFLLRFGARCGEFRRSRGVLHTVIRALAAAVALQWTAQVLHLLHLLAFERRGLSDSFVGAAADILFMLSQVVSSTLLIVIAQGYTLDRSRATLTDRAKRIAAAIALLHLLLVGHDILQGEHSDRHHENEGFVGWALLLVRVLLYVWFVVGVKTLQRDGGLRLQPFLSRFMLAGSTYFLAYPVIYLVVQLFAAYLQHPILEIGMVVMQTASALWLSDLFLSRGVYYQVSTLSESLLPGGCSPSSSPSALKHD